VVDISVDTIGAQSGRAAQFLACGGPGPWHQFIQAIVRPEIDEAGDHVGQIGLGVDAVEFAGLSLPKTSFDSSASISMMQPA
jgi:hypothetical protein